MAGLTTVTSGGITDGTITNADINASASIDASKVSGLSTDSITEGNTTVEVVDTGSDGHITFDTEGSEKARIDTSGRLLIGSNVSNGKFFNGSSVNHQLQVEHTGSNPYVQSWLHHANSATLAPHLTVGRSRGTSAGAVTIVQDGDTLANFSFQGTDGTNCLPAASIRAYVDGTPGSNDMPGRLSFWTNSGGTTTTERMRIDSSGRVGIGSNAPYNVLTGKSLSIGDGSASAEVNFLSSTTGTGALYFSDGTSGLDSYRGYLEYSHNSDFMRFGTNANERMRLDSSGRVGIGTNSPVHSVNISNGTVTGMLHADGSNNFGIGTYSNHSFAFYSNDTERARFNQYGNLLIGSTTQDNDNISGTGYPNLVQINGSGDGEGLRVANTQPSRIDIIRDVDETTVTDEMDLGFLSFGAGDGTSVQRAAIWAKASFSNGGTQKRGGKLLLQTADDNNHVPETRMVIKNDGNVKIEDGNLEFANGHGIDFSAQTATSKTGASTDVELFDHYEEGTFTPTMGYATAYGTQTGKYVKVGKTVHCVFEIQVTNFGGVTTASTSVGGLPFTGASNGNVTGCWGAVINAAASSKDWRIGPWGAISAQLGVWMHGGGSSTGIGMDTNSFDNYTSVTASLGTSFTMRGGVTYIAST